MARPFISRGFHGRRQPPTPLAAPPRIGSNGPVILTELGYTASEIERLEDAGIVGPIEWYRRMHQST